MRNKQQAAAQNPISEEEAVTVRNKKKKKRLSSPSPSAAAILEQEAKLPKKRKRGKEQEPSSQSPLPSGPGQGTNAPPEQEAADASKGKSSMKKSNIKKPRVLTDREIIKMRIQHLREHPTTLPQGFLPLNSVSNSTEHNPNYSSPFGAFFDQFCYKPIRQNRNPSLARTPDRLSRPPPRSYPSFESSQLTAIETSKANTSLVSKTKQQRSGSGSQAKVNVREKKNSEMMKTRTKKQRKPKPLLTSAEKRSDKYRRLPLDQLVPPLRSPHKLLQEEYASDPWKVILICMLLNLTQGKQRITRFELSNALHNLYKEHLLFRLDGYFENHIVAQVRKILSGFFRLYPDAQTAFNADPEEMERYLAPLGLQRVKTIRIQQFSREYVEKQWTYITELCGVGKYAADAYAIFCAGRATEVVPEDHKLVDYWKYVCSKLSMIQVVFPTQKENVSSADCTEKPQQKKRKAPAAEVAVLPQQKKMKAPAAEAAVSPQMKKRKTLSAESPQLKSKVAEDGQAESNMEKLFKKKCAYYSFLSEEVLELEAKQPGMFKVPFLKLADEKAHTLDTKIKKQRVEEIKVHMQRGDITNEVTNTLIKLLK